MTEIVQEREATPEPLDVDEGLPKEDEEKTGETEEVVVPGKRLDRTSTKIIYTSLVSDCFLPRIARREKC